MRCQKKFQKDYSIILAFGLTLILILQTRLTESAETELSAIRLQKYYGGISELNAQVVQRRYSKYLKTPFSSKVELKWKADSFSWTVDHPVPYSLISEKGKIRFQSEQNIEKLPDQFQEDVTKIVEFIHHLISANIAALEKNFLLSFESNELKAKPIDTEKTPIKSSVTLLFHPDLSLKLITIGEGNERSELLIEKINMIRK